MQQKYLFLDIDGVLNGNHEYRLYRALPLLAQQSDYGHRILINDVQVGMLNQITNATKAQIILSSSWRTKDVYPRDINSFLIGCGITAPIVGMTRDLGNFNTSKKPDESVVRVTVGSRGAEIWDFVMENNLLKSQYIILDDDKDILAPAWKIRGLTSRWIRTRSDRGLSDRHVKNAIAKLG